MTTHRVADEDHVDPGQGVHDDAEVAGEVLGGVAAIRRPVAEAMAALVEGDDVKPIREGRPLTSSNQWAWAAPP
jgi:hypothetical protein